MFSVFHGKKLDRAERVQLYVSYVLQVTIAGTVALSIYRKNWFIAFLTFGILILMFLPAMIQRSFKVYIPLEFHFITAVFVFAAFFLGEIHGYYTLFWWWDVILHTGSSILLGLIGFILVFVLNHEKSVHVKMKPGFVA